MSARFAFVRSESGRINCSARRRTEHPYSTTYFPCRKKKRAFVQTKFVTALVQRSRFTLQRILSVDVETAPRHCLLARQTRKNGFNFRVPAHRRFSVRLVTVFPFGECWSGQDNPRHSASLSSAVALTLFNFDRAPLQCA